jgi:cobalt/nickel transport system permease protein
LHELYLERVSWLHQQPARVKIIFTLAFILSVSLTPSAAWPAYILYLTLTVSAAILSKIDLGTLTKRALIALPFGLAALPLLFTGADQTLQIGPLTLGYSAAGGLRFISILIKIWLSVQAAILLNATTSFNDLLNGLAQLHMPDIFVAIYSLMWRYLFVIVQEAERMMLARASRSARLPGASRGGNTAAWRASVTGRMAGSLLLRSLERSDRVYLAMQARGYTGRQPESAAEKFSSQEILLVAGVVAILLMILFLGILTGSAV